MQEPLSLIIFNKRYKVSIAALLSIFVLIGAAIRFYGLSDYCLWLDELFSMNGADPTATWKDVYEYSKGDQPPFFFFVLHEWLKVFGYTPFAGRSLTVVFGLFGIPAIFFLGKEFKNTNIGLIAAFLTTINWFHADVSREIRFYPLVFLLSTLSYLFFLRSIKSCRIKDFFLYALFTGLLLNTHYFALAVFASQMILFLITSVFYKRDTKLIFGGLVAGAVAGLSILHWTSIILKDLQTEQFHVDPVSASLPFRFAWVYFKDPLGGIIYAFCIFLMTKFLIRGFSARKLALEDLIIVGWILIGFAIPLAYSLLRVPLLTPKYSIITFPAILLFISSGFVMISRERRRMYALTIIAVGAFVAMFISKPLNKPRVEDDWCSVARYFASHANEPQTIFAQLAYFHKFYFKKFGYKQELPIDQRWADFDAIVDSSQRIWLLRHPRYPDNGFSDEQQKTLDSAFQIVNMVQFHETKAFLYERKR